MRCFVAIELDQPLRKALLRLIGQELPRTRDVRWCNEQQLHVTLKFLGETSDQQFPAVCDAVAAAAAGLAPFQISLSELGSFPNARSPRVLWCGVTDPEGGCAKWVSNADSLFSELGFAPETRAYHPHITLGRSKGAAGGRLISDVLTSAPVPEAREMLVERVTVFESRLAPGGAQYTARFNARLGG